MISVNLSLHLCVPKVVFSDDGCMGRLHGTTSAWDDVCMAEPLTRKLRQEISHGEYSVDANMLPVTSPDKVYSKHAHVIQDTWDQCAKVKPTAKDTHHDSGHIRFLQLDGDFDEA